MRNAETLNDAAVADTRRSTLPPGRMLVRDANPPMEVPAGETVCQSAVGCTVTDAVPVGDGALLLLLPVAPPEAVGAPPPPRVSTTTAARTTTSSTPNRERVSTAEGPRRRMTDTRAF